MLMKKFLSVVLSMAMIMSICTVISPTLTASAEESTSQSDSLYNDFSSWKAEKSKGYYQWTGTWSVEDDSGVAGGKYLRFWHWENTETIIRIYLRLSQTLLAAQPPRAAGSLPQIQNIC